MMHCTMDNHAIVIDVCAAKRKTNINASVRDNICCIPIY